MSNFDINKHKNFEVITKQEVEKEGFPDESVKLYMDEIIKNKYIYTLEDIEDKHLNTSYVTVKQCRKISLYKKD